MKPLLTSIEMNTSRGLEASEKNYEETESKISFDIFKNVDEFLCKNRKLSCQNVCVIFL